MRLKTLMNKKMIVTRLQTQTGIVLEVKASDEGRNERLWVGLRGKDYPSFVVKTKRGYPNPPAFCIFFNNDARFSLLRSVVNSSDVKYIKNMFKIKDLLCNHASRICN